MSSPLSAALTSSSVGFVFGCFGVNTVQQSSNGVKMKILGVKEETLRTFGAVSENTAREMSQGVRKALGADIGVGITGIAGPLSDGTNKPVGLIYISVCSEKFEKTVELKNNFTENVREQNRLSAAKTALDLISEDELYE